MTARDAHQHPFYQSITLCAICGPVPQKVTRQQTDGEGAVRPPEVASWQPVLELVDAATHQYCSSITKLLKCPSCGTYYYYNHYDDQGESFMDPVSDEVTVRRYDPQTVIGFLGKLIQDCDQTLPSTIGQLGRAFLDGTTVPAALVAAEDRDKAIRLATAELASLENRYNEIIRDLTRIIRHGSPHWHIKMYAVEALGNHFSSRGDWMSINSLLIEHPDPQIQVAAARYLAGIGTGDAPALDLLHTSPAVAAFLKNELTSQDRLTALARVFMANALADPGMTLEYHYGFGSSTYRPQSIRSMALYGLVVLAGHQADLTWAVADLLNLLSDNRELNYEVCWVLRTMAAGQEGARAVGQAFAAMDEPHRREIAKDDQVREVLERCAKSAE